MATATASIPKTKGGAFLIEERRPAEIFSPEDFTEEHLAIARTADEFWAKEVEPNLEAIYHEPARAVAVLRKEAEIGLTAVVIPEEYGGMEMDLATAMLVTEKFGRDGSYGGWHGAHTGIGTLPILYFGTEEQKRRYLPKLATAELIAAYALTEPHAGSDAQAARTRAVLSDDRRHYILNGQKMWITNGGAADLFTVFAKVGDSEKLTAFLVERNFPGVSNGAEEKKMGIKGSSTTAVYFDNVPVPVENVLGEIDRGHIIAFNILNIGRLKLGPGTVGGSKKVLGISIKYAKERRAFGTTISTFGAIQHKLAEMAIRIYAAESAAYRVVGQVQSQLEGFSWKQPNASQTVLKALEEYAVECSIVKVFASEVLDYVVDEGVQIHGGYGFHQDYAVERGYRDARINRIFEGTNEINRLLITGMLLKRAAAGRLGLVQAAQALMGEILSGGGAGPDLLQNAKKIGLFAMGIAYQKYPTSLDQQQEVLALLSDIVMDIFTMESAQLRAKKIGSALAQDMSAVLVRDAMSRIEANARVVLGNCAEGDMLRTNMAVLRRLAKFEPVDSIGLRRKIAARLLEAERYAVA